MPNEPYKLTTVAEDNFGNAAVLHPDTKMLALHLGKDFCGHDFTPLFSELEAAKSIRDVVPCYKGIDGRLFVDAGFLIGLSNRAGKEGTGKAIAQFAAWCLSSLMEADKKPSGRNW